MCAIRTAVGPAVQLRADANRGWSLEEAVRFGTAVAVGGAALQYVEEPTHSATHLQPFFEATGEEEVERLGSQRGCLSRLQEGTGDRRDAGISAKAWAP